MNCPNPAIAAPSPWRAIVEHPLFAAALLMLPVVWLVQPLPIDETRYLAVAWEMRQTGEFLVPHLNGAWYSDKPPLLFWLVNLGWLVTGVHAWTARALTLACSAVGLILTARLATRLDPTPGAGRYAMWILLGTMFFGVFANAIMFDVLLATCVLVALHGVVDLTEGRNRRGIVVVALATGFGILAKGPVMLLDFGFAALLAPWWCARLDGRRVNYFGALAAGVVLGIAVALAWAVPAALHGGSGYANAIFLHQTVGRIAESFAHRRPVWWYLIVFPLMLLPWPLALRGPRSALAALAREPGVRFAIAWVVPTFVAFSLVSGKQPHYLLPIVPGVAVAAGVALARGALVVRPRPFGVLLLLAGLAMLVLPHFVPDHPNWSLLVTWTPTFGVPVVALGVVVLLLGGRCNLIALPAAASLAMVLVAKLVLVDTTGLRFDVRPAAAEIARIQQSGVPIAHLGWHHGVYEFAGRLREPLPVIEPVEWPAWAAAHRNGYVMSFEGRYRFAAKPVYTQPFRGGRIGIWTVPDALGSGFVPRAPQEPDYGDDGGHDDSGAGRTPGPAGELSRAIAGRATPH